MRLTATALDFNLAEAEKRITRFIKDYVKKAGAKGLVLGLSGGIDSCTVAALSAAAIGGRNVLGLMLPENETWSASDIEHAQMVVQKFGIKTEIIDITSSLEGIYRSIPDFDLSEKLAKGNIKARTRMIYIYYYANRLRRLVCGSSDKSEIMMGYFTKWGDVAADISPLMDLYKTQVRKLAAYVGLPKVIIEKPSSPALWPNQSAEGELGIKYDQLDLILFGLEHFTTTEEISSQLGISDKLVRDIKRRWLAAEHKRRVLLTAKLEYRTVGSDFRLPRDPYGGMWRDRL